MTRNYPERQPTPACNILIERGGTLAPLLGSILSVQRLAPLRECESLIFRVRSIFAGSFARLRQRMRLIRLMYQHPRIPGTRADALRPVGIAFTSWSIYNSCDRMIATNMF